jgi:hypothetical protein
MFTIGITYNFNIHKNSRKHRKIGVPRHGVELYSHSTDLP